MVVTLSSPEKKENKADVHWTLIFNTERLTKYCRTVGPCLKDAMDLLSSISQCLAEAEARDH